jgi:hypothetical protein
VVEAGLRILLHLAQRPRFRADAIQTELSTRIMRGRDPGGSLRGTLPSALRFPPVPCRIRSPTSGGVVATKSRSRRIGSVTTSLSRSHPFSDCRRSDPALDLDDTGRLDTTGEKGLRNARLLSCEAAARTALMVRLNAVVRHRLWPSRC